jgi:hypothetical protein
MYQQSAAEIMRLREEARRCRELARLLSLKEDARRMLEMGRACDARAAAIESGLYQGESVRAA